MVHVRGEGFIELFAWETNPGYAVHLLNYTNPNTYHGWIQSIYPVGPQIVQMTLPVGVKVKFVELLSAGQSVPFRVAGEVLSFTIPRLEDYEIAAITIARSS